jgi:hypothetical protein
VLIFLGSHSLKFAYPAEAAGQKWIVSDGKKWSGREPLAKAPPPSATVLAFNAFFEALRMRLRLSQ